MIPVNRGPTAASIGLLCLIGMYLCQILFPISGKFSLPVNRGSGKLGSDLNLLTCCCSHIQSDPDLGTPSGERPLSTKSGVSTKSGSNKVNFLYRGKKILSLNRGVPKSGVPKSGSDLATIEYQYNINVIESDPDLPGPDLPEPRFTGRINFPRSSKLTDFDPDIPGTPNYRAQPFPPSNPVNRGPTLYLDRLPHMSTPMYLTINDSHWIRPLDIVLGIAFLIISVSTIFLNTFVIYSFAKTSRKLQGTSLVLFQVAINDLISGIQQQEPTETTTNQNCNKSSALKLSANQRPVFPYSVGSCNNKYKHTSYVGVVVSCNILSGRSSRLFGDSPGFDIIFCQMYAVLLDIIYIAAPILLAIATTLRVVAVLWPYKYQKVNNDLKVIPMIFSSFAWILGIIVGLFPFLFGTWMCFMPKSGSCDYFVIEVLNGDADLTRVFSLLLFVIPGNISYVVIVVGGAIVIHKLFQQNRMTLPNKLMFSC
eukprot:sb/3464261/